MMHTNKQAAQQFIDGFQSGDDALLRSVMATEVVDHNPLPGQRPALDGVLDTLAMYRAAFPDLAVTVERQIAEEAYVVQTGLASGTNTGPLMGGPATGLTASFAWIDMYRFTDGRITEIWHLEDIAGMLRQLGAAPAAR